MDIGEKICGLRKEKGITQEQLAGLLNVSRELVVKWENGSRRPDYPTIEKAAAVFGIPADGILSKDSYIFTELSDCVPENVEMTDGELSVKLNGFLRNCNRRYADIFILRYTYLKEIPEIAVVFGIGENHVRSILSKMRKKLKKHLTEVEK